ncbi:MAG: DUF433 domain-containing protein [Deltaproteobacteria bacterium]|nr:DUF433 domain-containing protein [Deltaproteobacteria bacterium]
MREIQLRNGEHTWATLRIEPDGRKLLCHRLSAAEIAACPPLVPFEGSKRLDCKLIISSHGLCVEIVGADGALQLSEGYDGELAEVVDPSGDAQLIVVPAPSESIAVSAVHEGRLALKQCRIKTDPAIMMGKPVVKGTRLTVELLLRRLGGGTTEDQLLADYPQLSPEDIHEALTYAANFLAAHAGPPTDPRTTGKS